jgi:hypothetical protein
VPPPSPSGDPDEGPGPAGPPTAAPATTILPGRAADPAPPRPVDNETTGELPVAEPDLPVLPTVPGAWLPDARIERADPFEPDGVPAAAEPVLPTGGSSDQGGDWGGAGGPEGDGAGWDAGGPPPAGVPASPADLGRIGSPPPSHRVGRRTRTTAPPPISPGRAVAGAALAVAGVALGIGAVLTLTDDPDDTSSGPVAARPSASATPTPAVTTPTVVAPTSTAPVPTAPAAPTTAPPVPTTAPPAPPPAAVVRPPLTVLNNSRITGLAATKAATFAKDGWTIAGTGNYSGRVAASTVYFDPGQEAAAQQLASAYGIPRTLPRFNSLPGSGLTVVLTKDAA